MFLFDLVLTNISYVMNIWSTMAGHILAEVRLVYLATPFGVPLSPSLS